MQHHRHTGREQLGPHSKIKFSLRHNTDAIDEPDQPGDDESSCQLARPGYAGGIERQTEVKVRGVVRLAVESEVGVHVLVWTKVQDDDAPQKGKHGRVFGDEADEDVADADLLVGAVGLAVEVGIGQEPVDGAGHEDGCDDDQGRGGEDLKHHELLWRAEAGV